MTRNVTEQINYLLKRRKSGMSNADFKNELFYLCELGFKEGKEWEDQYWIYKIKKESTDNGEGFGMDERTP